MFRCRRHSIFTSHLQCVLLRCAKAHVSALDLAAAAAAKTEAAPTLFERLFGKPSPPATLAYASADDQSATNQNLGNIGGRFDHWTAVYDITAHKVYLPDGRALEAHSGYGDHSTIRTALR